MARSRSRRSSGGGLPFVLGVLALLLLFGVIGFAAYVYFFVPLEEPADVTPTDLAETSAPAPRPPTAVAGAGGSISPAARAGGSPTAGTPGAAPRDAGAARPTALATASAGATPAGTPTRATIAYRSNQFSYSLSYPDNWAVRSGGVKLGELTADAFIGPADSGFTPSITIYGQPVDDGVQSDTFALANLQSLGAGGVQAQAQPEAVPPGAKALIVKYPVAAGDLKYNVTQVLFVQEGTGWVVTLSTPPVDNGTALAALRQMLATFRGEKPRT